MVCQGCGNDKAWAVHHKREQVTGKIYFECNRCFDPSIPESPDVYFREPYWDEHLHDRDDPSYDVNKGTFIRSKKHKAYVMKKVGLFEAGDRRHGSNSIH